MKKKGLLVLLLIFIIMFILNSFTPLLSDDYFSAFIWPQRVALNDVTYAPVRRLSGLEDILRGLRGYYDTWGGRVPGSFPVSFFVWQGKEFFNPINAIMIPALVAEIYWLAHEGTVSVDFNPPYLVWIFFAIWAFNVSFIDTCLWLAGSSNYLWMLVIVLAFLIPYIRSYFDANAFKNSGTRLTIGIFFLGLLAGWSHETTNCWIVLMLLYLLYVSRKKGELRQWKISGFTGFCLGYALLVFAPGNFSRLQMQQNTDSVVIASELLSICINIPTYILPVRIVIYADAVPSMAVDGNLIISMWYIPKITPMRTDDERTPRRSFAAESRYPLNKSSSHMAGVSAITNHTKNLFPSSKDPMVSERALPISGKIPVITTPAI